MLGKNDGWSKEAVEHRAVKGNGEWELKAEVEKGVSLVESIKAAKTRGRLVPAKVVPVKPKNTVEDSKKHQAKKKLNPEQQQIGKVINHQKRHFWKIFFSLSLPPLASSSAVPWGPPHPPFPGHYCRATMV